MPYFFDENEDSVRPDCNILDLDPAVLIKLVGLLNDGKRWQNLLQVIPDDYCSLDQAKQFEAPFSLSSPATQLLFHLGSQGVTVEMMVCWLDKISLERGLLLLKEDEPLEILEHPVEDVEIVEGSLSCLRFKCVARGYPEPTYQWFKGEEELIAKDSSTLNISPVTVEDTGWYTCRVHNWDRKTGIANCLFSNIAVVRVLPSAQRSNTVLSVASSPNISKAILFNSEAKLNCSSRCQQVNAKCTGYLYTEIQPQKENSKSSSEPNSTLLTEKIEINPPKIIKQPTSPCNGKITQGSSISLRCKGHSSHPINYQWFRNGLVMEGETNPDLNLHDIYPDSENGDSKWYFNCLLYNEHGSIFTKSVEIELDNPNEHTQYFAEDKVALIIANDTYPYHPTIDDLTVPALDANTLSNLLLKLDFKVLSFTNLNREEMKNAVKLFCCYLRKGVYGVFYYVGHGFEQYGQCYLQPVDCTSYVPNECICAQYVLQCMQEKDPKLCVLLLDTCRSLPPQYRQGEALIPGKIFEPKMSKNTVIGYATSFLCDSFELGGARNGFFIHYLQKHLLKKKKITDLLFTVQEEFERNTFIRNRQHPWIGSSLSLSLTLSDPIIEHNNTELTREWKCMTTLPANKTLNMPKTPIAVVLQFDNLENTFCNCLQILVKIKSLNNDPVYLCQYEASIRFSSKNLDIDYSAPNPSHFQTETEKPCCMVNVFHLQRLHGNPLIGEVLILHLNSKRIVDAIDVNFGHPLIAQFNYF